mmetsp:Transcript_23665/g.29304  ORF Transcript_23665/g.29304 Transcript_23665/m.29304 type:complete len:202 (+) Transcript_23665:115-720(+)
MHNVFEMGFDILQKDPAVMESIISAKKARGEVNPETAAALEDYMSQHHSGEPHNIEALQAHLTGAGILTQPHAPMHDMLTSAGLLEPLSEEYIHDAPKHHHGHTHHHHHSHHGDAELIHEEGLEHPYEHHYEPAYDLDAEPLPVHRRTTPAHDVLADRHRMEQEMAAMAIEEDFASKLIDYKTKQTGHEFRLFGHTMVSYD